MKRISKLEPLDFFFIGLKLGLPFWILPALGAALMFGLGIDGFLAVWLALAVAMGLYSWLSARPLDK